MNDEALAETVSTEALHMVKQLRYIIKRMEAPLKSERPVDTFELDYYLRYLQKSLTYLKREVRPYVEEAKKEEGGR